MTIRVIVVEDSLTMRKRLCEVLTADPEIEVVAELEDGKQAIEACQRLRPNLVTLDMMLPVMSGLAATEYIMAHCPTPILIVSSSTNRGELFKTYEALASGAVDVLEKPRGDETDDEWERQFVSTVRLVSKIKVITHPRARLRNLGRLPSKDLTPVIARPQTKYRVTAIGASTGGPAAIVHVLRSLGPTYPLPVLLVLHIGEAFGKAFADWLDGQTALRVSYAQDGDLMSQSSGRVIMAPPGRHLVVSNGKLHLTAGPERHSCRPSVDVLFESVAAAYGSTSVGCLLTGMGRDGAAGLLAIKQAGGLTLAQDESTSVVFGMPREAIERGAACRVLPLQEIGPVLAGLSMEATQP
jgi:two-component system chemotaxis response regulator CheB